jgi:hypothetical protein
VRLSPLLLLLPTLAFAQDLQDILKPFLEAADHNGEKAGQYTYVEQADHFSFDKNGQAKKFSSETCDIIFVEGGAFRKLVARNDAPLDPKEQAKEDKRLQAFATLRRKQAHSGVFHKNFQLGSNDDLLTLFDCRLTGEEEVRARKAWVVECAPKVGHRPVDAREKQVMAFQRKLWIDQLDYAVARKVFTVVGPGVDMTPGSTFSWEFEKIAAEVWMQTSGVIAGHLQFAKLIKPQVRTEYEDSKFQKFDVQSTITVEK